RDGRSSIRKDAAASDTRLLDLFIATPSFEVDRPARAQLPVIVGPGANGEFQFHAIERHVLRRLEFECQTPFCSWQLQLGGNYPHFGCRLYVRFLAITA